MITTEMRNKILSLFTGKIKNIAGTGMCYLGFSSTTPGNDGSNFTEPTTGDYERVQLNILEAIKWTDTWSDVTEGTVTNAKELVTKECKQEGGWPEFTHFGIFDAKTGGKPIAFDLLRDPDGDEVEGVKPAKSLKIEKNNVAVFRVGTLSLNLT